jgi:phosphatidylglycerol:prolipoprotein diacylglycerol transferase
MIVFLKKRGELPAERAAQSGDLFFWTVAGAFAGGKLGYILLYAGEVFLADPAVFFLPYSPTDGWRGLPGMSYHGALVGAVLAVILFSRFHRLPLLPALDLMALLAPVITFFGRLGNFFTGELPGRLTEKSWGVIFPETLPSLSLRHPATLYEAALEGILLFFVLWYWRKRFPPGGLFLFYIMAYSVLRFLAEFFREPDPQRGFYFGILTLGQILSLAFFLAAGLVWRTHGKRSLPREVKP